MTNKELDNWWSSLTVSEKIRVASKATSKILKKQNKVLYPECTHWWNAQSESTKQTIYKHLTDDHGIVIDEWSEGNMYSE